MTTLLCITMLGARIISFRSFIVHFASAVFRISSYLTNEHKHNTQLGSEPTNKRSDPRIYTTIFMVIWQWPSAISTFPLAGRCHYATNPVFCITVAQHMNPSLWFCYAYKSVCSNSSWYYNPYWLISISITQKLHFIRLCTPNKIENQNTRCCKTHLRLICAY